MELDKLTDSLDVLLSGLEKSESDEPETKQMSKKDFAAYAKEQVAAARADLENGEEGKAVAKARLIALKEQVEAVSKFEFRAGELPRVTIFRHPWQNVSTESAGNTNSSQPAGGNAPSHTAKSMAALEGIIDAALKGDAGEPPLDDGSGETDTQDESVYWPRDMAKALDKDEKGNIVHATPDWGADPESVKALA